MGSENRKGAYMTPSPTSTVRTVREVTHLLYCRSCRHLDEEIANNPEEEPSEKSNLRERALNNEERASLVKKKNQI
jgi:hypothetical protein